jgi:hypothetical protein
MAYTTINKSTAHFNTKLWTGNGSAGHAITGVGHQPDLTWIKVRNQTGDHGLWDSVRGVSKRLQSNENSAETTTSGVTSFNTDGFTMGTSYNGSGNPYASWNWKANGSSTTTNNDGATTSYISHNSTGKFSIIKYTGTGSATNIGHGLGGTPDYFIVKARSASDWHVWCNNFPAQKRIKLNSTGGWSTNTSIFASLPDATKIYFGSGGDVNGSGVEYICYAWKNVTGFSKAGSYKGNGNADGSFVYTGFKPTFLFYRNVSATENWEMADTQRSPENLDDKLILYANGTNADVSTTRFDFLSNGFKARSTNTAVNASGNEYMYLAFGQSIVGSNNIPATAR